MACILRRHSSTQADPPAMCLYQDDIVLCANPDQLDAYLPPLMAHMRTHGLTQHPQLAAFTPANVLVVCGHALSSDPDESAVVLGAAPFVHDFLNRVAAHVEQRLDQCCQFPLLLSSTAAAAQISFQTLSRYAAAQLMHLMRAYSLEALAPHIERVDCAQARTLAQLTQQASLSSLRLSLEV
eukprot:6479850-Amphidinium_carterae.1